MKLYKKIILIVLASVALIVALLACGYYLIFQKNNIAEEGFIKIYRNMDYEQVSTAIDTSGILANKATFHIAARTMGLERYFEPGLYKFKKGMNNKAIIRTIANGWQTPTDITITGYIRSKEKLAQVLSSKLEADSTLFMQVLSDTILMHSFGFTEASYPGMIIPNTYEMWWTVTPVEFLERMKKEYDRFWNEERCAKADSIGLTKEQVSTLASIVIEETKYEPEMATIAGVYMNRLKKGMRLQADPTVLFAIGDRSIRRVLRTHLNVDSPYNTYKYTGLPPGPITIPPISALDAVLNYEDHDYIYFCAKDTFDGQHSFAKDYKEHMRNARAYHRAFTAREKAKSTEN